jgi:hypothetical protein
VSCESRAGCCCGWNSASKFQKLQVEMGMHWNVKNNITIIIITVLHERKIQEKIQEIIFF